MAVLEVTDSTFQSKVLDNHSDKVVLVDFWAEWCGPCKMLAPILESISNKLSDKIEVFKLNTDQNMETAQKYQISGIPCVVVFKKGAEVGRITGFKPEPAFETELSQYLA